MVYRIEIGLKDGMRDANAESVCSKARISLGISIEKAVTRTVYKIDADITEAEGKQVCELFRDPVIETAALGRLPPPAGFQWLIEVGFKPGVTDNIGRTALVALEDIVGRRLPDNAQVYTSIQYFIYARGMALATVRKLAYNLLANQLIHSVAIFSKREWLKSEIDMNVPSIHGKADEYVGIYDLSGTDADLEQISREKILSLSIEEMHAIRDYFQKTSTRRARQALTLPPQPTDVEVECIAQTWSEHCRHKIFSAVINYTDEYGSTEKISSLFKTYIRGATEKIGRSVDWLVSVFKDNAGIIRFNKRLHLVYKIETHNTPSALDPYGGAMTGIVGVNRDPMGTGLGAGMLCNVWGYCLGSPFYQGYLPKGLMHPRRIRDGVHQGVIEGGNQSGIPWMRGFEIFDERFLGKPLVFCGTVGILPVKVNKRPSERKEVMKGDAIIMVGGRIGKDGIHGATFSSEELREQSPVQAVQIGDPITQRKMYEFLMEARDLGLYRCITDNGAGGLSCSVGEMGRLSGGAEIDLSKAPLKYLGLKPWEIFLSEAQERMTLAVPQDKVARLTALAKKRDVEVSVLGTFTNSGALVVRYGAKVVGRLEMDFLYEGCPVMSLEAKWNTPASKELKLPKPGNRNRLLCNLLAGLEICSKEFKSRQYDGEVKGLSVIKPYLGVKCDIPADASVMRVEYGSNEGIVLAEGINPFRSDSDTYHMAASVIDEAVRRVISAGGRMDRIAGLDNFCWPDPVLSEKTSDGPHKLAQLVRANKALYEVTTAYGVPCISGKDSCKNDSTRGGKKISIPPTLLFSVITKIDDVRNVVTLDFKKAGDLIYVVGLTRNELGASALSRVLKLNNSDGRIPKLDPKQGKTVCKAVETAIRKGLVSSSHAVARGGLASAFTFCCLGGDRGADINLCRVPQEKEMRDDELLFSESNSRFIISIEPRRRKELEKALKHVPYECVGTVTMKNKLVIKGIRNKKVVSIAVQDLRKAFKGTLYGI
jgi:phosphoribosylformylglycinamidine synthase